MAIRTAAQALAKAAEITTGYGGYCLKFVQDCYGAKAVYPSAIAAWNASQHKHRTSSTAGIPVGAPVYFSGGGPYGHVAIYVGDGNMRTTNSATNRIHTDPVSRWTGSYGYTLLGWTDDIEGQMIPGLSAGGDIATVTAGTYRCDVSALNVRTAPNLNANVVATYKRGQTVILDAWSEYHDGYLWGRYTGASSGQKRYVAISPQSGTDRYLTRV